MLIAPAAQGQFFLFLCGRNDCVAVHLRKVRRLTNANELSPFGWLPRAPSLPCICPASSNFATLRLPLYCTQNVNKNTPEKIIVLLNLISIIYF